MFWFHLLIVIATRTFQIQKQINTDILIDSETR